MRYKFQHISPSIRIAQQQVVRGQQCMGVSTSTTSVITSIMSTSISEPSAESWWNTNAISISLACPTLAILDLFSGVFVHINTFGVMNYRCDHFRDHIYNEYEHQ